MGVGAVFARGRHIVALDDVVERQAGDVLVEVPRLFRIARLVGVVVQLDGGGRWQLGSVGQAGVGHSSYDVSFCVSGLILLLH